MVATDVGLPEPEEKDAAEITRDVIEPAILPEPVPEFDKLYLKVGRGDTMEKLFRRNSLDIGHLMAIAQLDEAKMRFRRIKPGDIFEVTHDETRPYKRVRGPQRRRRLYCGSHRASGGAPQAQRLRPD